MDLSLKTKINTAMKKEKCDLIIKNARIINVFTNEVIIGSLGIKDGVIIGIGDYRGKKIIDAKRQYVSPGFIDSHVHIESSMVTPPLFAKNVVPMGTTTVIADPHEIANICGIKGIDFFLNSTSNLPLDVFIMLPSCVPSTKFETSGAILKASNLKKLINHSRVKGLGELMDYIGVINSNKDILDKLLISKNKIIDGHSSNLFGTNLNAYSISGVKTNHECTTVKEMLSQLRVGFYIQIRQGSATKDVKNLIPALNKNNIRRCLFCSDDKHPEEIMEKGHINENVNIAIQNGIDPIDAIKIASLNAAECYNLNKGAIAPGYDADLIIFKDLQKIIPTVVIKSGKVVSRDNKPLFKVKYKIPKEFLSKINIKKIETNDLKIFLKNNYVNVIKIIPGGVVTKKIIRKVKINNGIFIKDSSLDICKIIVIERHTGKSKLFVGLIEGFNFKNCAISSTIAHDSHNLIVAGDNDEDILNCIERTKKLKGGIVISSKKNIVGELQLKIAGIMSDKDLVVVNESMKNLTKIANKLNINKKINPFMTLSFMSLPVIPEIKITDKGLFDVSSFNFIDIEA